MEVLSAFSGCYLEEIKLTVLILSNLATLSEHPFKNKKADKTRTHKICILCMCGHEWFFSEYNCSVKRSLYDSSSLTIPSYVRCISLSFISPDGWPGGARCRVAFILVFLS